MQHIQHEHHIHRTVKDRQIGSMTYFYSSTVTNDLRRNQYSAFVRLQSIYFCIWINFQKLYSRYAITASDVYDAAWILHILMQLFEHWINHDFKSGKKTWIG